MSGQRYFDEALSDFRFEIAAGGEIRHMISKGYSIPQIMEQLTVPMPRKKVEKSVLETCLKQQIVVLEFHKEFKTEIWHRSDRRELCRIIREKRTINGEENSYVLCPYGTWYRDRKMRLDQAFACLTGRERDYIAEFPWPMQNAYHRLNSRMYEIYQQMILETDEVLRFFFLKTGEEIRIE